jgi:hypothetical protein
LDRPTGLKEGSECSFREPVGVRAGNDAHHREPTRRSGWLPNLQRRPHRPPSSCHHWVRSQATSDDVARPESAPVETTEPAQQARRCRAHDKWHVDATGDGEIRPGAQGKVCSPTTEADGLTGPDKVTGFRREQSLLPNDAAEICTADPQHDGLADGELKSANRYLHSRRA